MRLWAILRYLDQRRNEGEPCKLWNLQTYQRSSWKATKWDVDRAIEEGWVSHDESEKAYEITEQGRKYLEDLRRLMEPLYSKHMQRFLGRR